MDSDRGVQIVVGCSHDSRSGASGRKAGNVDALWINRIVPHDLAGDARDQRGLACAALLVGGAKPVPAFRRVGVAALRRIDHEASLFLCDEVHPGAGGEIVRRLGAAVKHDDQRKRLPLIAAGDEELVGSASRRVAVGAFDELCALRHDVGHRSRRALDALAGRARCRPWRGRTTGGAGRAGRRRPARAARSVSSTSLAFRSMVGGVGLGRRMRPGLAMRRRRALAAKHALQQRRGFGELARLGQPCGFAKCVLVQHRIHLVLSARAALTAGVACRAPSTETEAMVARARSAVTSCAMLARPRTLMCNISPACRAASRSARGVVPQTEIQAFAGRGLLDDVGVAFELIADRRSDEIGAVRIESVLHHQIDVAQVDIAKIDRDFFGFSGLRSEFADISGHGHFHPYTICMDGIWMSKDGLQVRSKSI